MKCHIDGAARSVALVTAIALDEEGRKVLCGPQLVVSDACPGPRAAIEEVFVGAAWQRCTVHLMRYMLGKIRGPVK